MALVLFSRRLLQQRTAGERVPKDQQSAGRAAVGHGWRVRGARGAAFRDATGRVRRGARCFFARSHAILRSTAHLLSSPAFITTQAPSHRLTLLQAALHPPAVSVSKIKGLLFVAGPADARRPLCSAAQPPRRACAGRCPAAARCAASSVPIRFRGVRLAKRRGRCGSVRAHGGGEVRCRVSSWLCAGLAALTGDCCRAHILEIISCSSGFSAAWRQE